MDTLRQDIRATLRSLRRNAGFAAAAILIVALGIAVNTTVFSVVHGTLLAPLPYPNPDRLMMIWKDIGDGAYARAPLSAPEVSDLRRGASFYDAIGSIWVTSGTLVEDGHPESVRVGEVTANFLTILGVAPARGRWFAKADEDINGAPTIIISGGLWQRRFGGADVIGRTVRIDGGWGLDGGTYTIVGIMPSDFEMLLPLDSSVPRTVDIWMPFRFDFAAASSTSYLRTVGRLKPDAPVSDAQQQTEQVARDKAFRNDRARRRVYAVPLHDDLVRQARPALLALQAAVGVVLLIVCANVASLLLVRAHVRRREIGVRLALGASRMRLARLLLTEGLMLALLGGLLGLALATLGLRLLPLIDTGSLPRSGTVRLSGTVLAFTALTTMVCGLFFGLTPLISSLTRDVVAALRSGTGSSGAHTQRTRSVLVLAEISLSVVLLIGAGLLIRSFLNLQAVNPGYNPDHVLTCTLSLTEQRYSTQKALSQFVRDLERTLREVPGVQAAGVINQLPLDDAPNWSTTYWTRATAGDMERPEADARLVTPGYFDALHATLVSGRWFTPKDDESQSLVLIVDERLAKRAWPDRSPLEESLQVQVYNGDSFVPRWGRVIGVVRHIRHHRLSEEVREQVFVPFPQAPRNQMAIVIHTPVDTEHLIPAIVKQIHTIDPELAPGRFRPLEEYVDHSRAPARFMMLLATLFAGLSLLLACLGLYGVISYAVAQRTAELGVRAALGARASDLVRLILQQGITLTMVGLLIGLTGAALAAGWLQSLLFGLRAFDPLTFVGVLLILGLTALLACYIPARRAARVDPADALRNE